MTTTANDPTGRPRPTRAQADRIAFLVDAEAYFGALARSLSRARRSIFIVGWDIHSELRLTREDDAEGTVLRELLDRSATENADLRIHVLLWDCSVLMASRRQWLPEVRLGWTTHDRVRIVLDDDHPAGACHHEKLVVVDDEVAFVGGIDLTSRRWDTPEHDPRDPRRVDPSGDLYPPCHDVQAVLSGAVARRLGDRARERWRRALPDDDPWADVSERRSRPEGPGAWPAGVRPDLRDVPVEIAITEPAHEGRPPRFEIEDAYRDAIERSTSFVYIENQYLTSDSVASMLEAALARSDGPEVCVVLPESVSGWLEDRAMSALRARVLARLAAADRHDRLAVWFPAGPGERDPSTIVHSKLCIVDDTFLTLGSANLSNRSMQLDTECNLVIRCSAGSETASTLGRLRARLLADHAGVDHDRASELLDRHGSMKRAAESLAREGSRLRKLPFDRHVDADGIIDGVLGLADPERPLDWDRFRRWMGNERGE